jgi:hypothetical protein
MLGCYLIDLPRAWMRRNAFKKAGRLSIGLQEDGALRSQDKKFSMRDEL